MLAEKLGGPHRTQTSEHGLGSIASTGSSQQDLHSIAEQMLETQGLTFFPDRQHA